MKGRKLGINRVVGKRQGRVAIAVCLSMTYGQAMALNAGTDLGLTEKPVAGAMAGAAYAKPQEVSAALFGNPAALTQFGGTQFGLGAAILKVDLKNTQSGIGGTNTSKSAADDYIIPDFAFSNEIAPGLVIAAGIGVDSGIGVDYRKDPIHVAGIQAASLPLVVELLSFSANIGLAKQVTPQTSVGVALTAGFGLAQLGTAGPSGAGVPTGAFGGTTSSVHDLGVRAALGVTHALTQSMTLSASYKSKLKYNFSDILHTTVAPEGYQSLVVEQPAEFVAGFAFDIKPGWMVETDIVWKNWENAATYKDVYKNQWLFLIGTQYKTGPWSLRFGYSYASDILRKEPNDTLYNLHGVGTLPLPMGGNDLVKVVQTTLLPVVTKNTLTAGVGYDLSKNVRLDVFGAYQFKESVTRSTPNIDTALGLTTSSSYQADLRLWGGGLGVSFKF